MILISLSCATPQNRLNVDSAEAKIKINSIIILEHQLLQRFLSAKKRILILSNYLYPQLKVQYCSLNLLNMIFTPDHCFDIHSNLKHIFDQINKQISLATVGRCMIRTRFQGVLRTHNVQIFLSRMRSLFLFAHIVYIILWHIEKL